jgi:hypothetical protein
MPLCLLFSFRAVLAIPRYNLPHPSEFICVVFAVCSNGSESATTNRRMRGGFPMPNTIPTPTLVERIENLVTINGTGQNALIDLLN